jgi:hypothetical protein
MSQPELIDAPGARLVLYRDAPSWDGEPTAALGRIAFASPDAGAALLQRAASRLRDEGVSRLVGPMDGDTWHSYRAVIEDDGTPPFLMEPTSGASDVAAFRAAGFEVIETYASARATLPEAIGPAPATPAPLIEPWDGGDPARAFAEIHALSSAAFARNRFYRALPREAFLALYAPVVPLLVPDLILFARDPDTSELIGYLFGLPDPRAATPTVILKTYASARKGVGHHLAHAFHARAHAMGFGTVIHALMHEDNVSASRSRSHAGEVFRRYALFGLRLDG